MSSSKGRRCSARLDERDRKVRTHVRRNIADYYLTAYPELKEKLETEKKKRITYAKVQKVKRDRTRALRRG